MAKKKVKKAEKSQGKDVKYGKIDYFSIKEGIGLMLEIIQLNQRIDRIIAAHEQCKKLKGL